jgi:hypothetical protein
MMCRETKIRLSSYLDGALTGSEMQQTEEHLAECRECRRQFDLLRQTQTLVAGLGRRPAPANLPLQLRIALSRQKAAARRSVWDAWQLGWSHTVQAFMLPVTAGVLSAVLTFGLLIGFFALPQKLRASDGDVPTSLYTAPELWYSPFEVSLSNVNADSIVVEASIGANGRVQDYKILSAPPSDMSGVLPQLNNMLIFIIFRPATAFGQPTVGKTVLSFSKINVQG